MIQENDKKVIDEQAYIRYQRPIKSSEELVEASSKYYQLMDERRTVRDFSDREIPLEVITNIIKTASTAPSGAHKQPYTFCVVGDAEIKKSIREAAEKEEYDSYHGRMNEKWLDDLKPLGTNWKKPFLEIAPYLIIVFKKPYGEDKNEKTQHYYVNESVGLACGFLLSAIHQAGLVSLTHTPSPMNFLSEILDRPKNEKPYLLIPVGYPAEEVYVPDIKRKPLDQLSAYYL